MDLMGKSTISMAIFNSYVSLPEGNDIGWYKYRSKYKTQGTPSAVLLSVWPIPFLPAKLKNAHLNSTILDNYWLVVWKILEHVFPYIGNVIIPTDELIFFRGVGQSPTRCPIIGFWAFEVHYVSDKPIIRPYRENLFRSEDRRRECLGGWVRLQKHWTTGPWIYRRCLGYSWHELELSFNPS